MSELEKPMFEVGEKVLVVSKYVESIRTITKVNKIKAGYNYFIDSDVFKNGTRKIDSFTFVSLYKLTPEKETLIRNRNKKRNIALELINVGNGFYSLSLDQLERIYNIIKEGKQ